MYTEIEFSSHSWPLPTPGRACADDRADPRLESSRRPAHRAVGGRTPGAPSPASRTGATPVEGPRERLRLSAVACVHPLVVGPCADTSRATYTMLASHVSPAVSAAPCASVADQSHVCRPPLPATAARGRLRIDSRPGPPAAIVDAAGRSPCRGCSSCRREQIGRPRHLAATHTLCTPAEPARAAAGRVKKCRA